MQNLGERVRKARDVLTQSIEIFGRVWHIRTHPEAMDPFLDSLRTRGKSEADVAAVRDVLLSLHEAENDRAAIFRIDGYLLTGVGAVDLVLIPVVLPMGVPDRPLFLATLFLAISLVLVASSLCVNFVKKELGITLYGKAHSNVVAFAEAFGFAALTATFWHSSTLVGIVFLVLAIPAFFLFVSYYTLAKVAVGFVKLQHAVNHPAAAGADGSSSTGPGEPAT